MKKSILKLLSVFFLSLLFTVSISSCGDDDDEDDGPVCTNTCEFARDGDCDDGGSGSDFDLCDLGTDCVDCGNR